LAGLIYAGGNYAIYGSVVSTRALEVSSIKVGLGFGEALVRGILCNWLMCLAIWISGSTDDTAGKILACIMPVAAFVAMGFEHSVANMFMIPLGILMGSNPSITAGSGIDLSSLTVSGLISKLVLVTIGNLIGGALFVAAAYWYVYLRDQSKF
jgi:formate/nitrite transporter